MESIWKIKDNIKTGKVTFQVGEEVSVFRRKYTGYPHYIKDDEKWFVREVDRDYLIVAKHSEDGIGWLQGRRIHKSYFLPKYYLRDMKLNSLLSEKN